MNERPKFIFDMDGTLYQFDKKKDQVFTGSQFYTDLQGNIQRFFVNRLGLSEPGAIAEYNRLFAVFNGEVSLGLEAEHGIRRTEYFSQTWNLNPHEYMERDPNLPEMLAQLQGRIALLTAAPRVWAVRVLAFLDIKALFEDKIFTGDPDERKPNPVVFQNIADAFGDPPSNVFSIGDQEHTDIIPAKSIGMKTVRIGSSDTVADYFADDVTLAVALLRKEGFV